MVKRRVESATQNATPAHRPSHKSDSSVELESAVDVCPMPAQKRAKFSIHDILLQNSSVVDSADSRSTAEDHVCSFASSPTARLSTHSAEGETDEPRTATESPTSTNGGADSRSVDASTQLAVNWTLAGDSPALANVRCVLESRELWTKFHKLGTEMIITKSGRRMFPTVKARLEGCDPDSLYYVFLDVIPVDAKRYRYVYNKSAWLTAGKAEPSPRCRVYMHPDSPFSGRQLAAQVISFEKAKLTNNEVDRTGHLVLNSMHKYQPRVHVVRRDRHAKSLDGNSTDFDLSLEDYRTFQFAETQFMAVTAYQNQLITKLKIEKNPFAKGFRDPTGRGNDLGDLGRQLENLPRQIFEHPAAAALFLSQCWTPSGPPTSLFDSTNLPKLLASFPTFPPIMMPPVTTSAAAISAKSNSSLASPFFAFSPLANGPPPPMSLMSALFDPSVAAFCGVTSSPAPTQLHSEQPTVGISANRESLDSLLDKSAMQSIDPKTIKLSGKVMTSPLETTHGPRPLS